MRDQNLIKAQVLQALPQTKFKVRLEDGRELQVYLSGRMYKNYIKVIEGDFVLIVLSPIGDQGRIVKRL